MARAPRRLRLARTLFFAAAPLLVSPGAGAMALGEPEVRSALGETLDARIAVTLAPGESMEPSCFSLLREPGASAPQLTAATLSLERSASGKWLRIRSHAPLDQPSVALSVKASCPGLAAEYRRDFALTLGARAEKRPAAAQAPVTPMAIAATLIARIGDTLESIARAIFPDNSRARTSYVVALREANPALASLGDREAIPIDSPIALPDLRAFARRQSQLASAEPREERAAAPRAEKPARREPRESPSTGAERRAEAAAPSSPKPPRASKPAREPKAAAQRAMPSRPASSEERPARVAAPAPPQRPRSSSGAFQLKLSSGEVDLSRTRGMDDRKRAELRDRQMVLDVDDQVAAVLELRHSVRQLETKVAELQLKLAAMPSAFPPPKVAAPIPPAPAPKQGMPPPPPPAPIAPAVPAKEAPAPTVVASAPKEAAPPPAPKVEAPPAPKAETPPAPKAETPVPPKPVAAPKEAPPVAAKATPAETKPASPPSAPAKFSPAPEESSWIPTLGEDGWTRYTLWLLAILLLAAAAFLAVRMLRRRRATAAGEEDEVPEIPEEEQIVVADEVAPPAAAVGEETPLDAGRVIASDSELATRLPDGDVDTTRRRYIEERFPEVATGAIALDDPASVVKAARLFYEDGALARAVELLQLAIERTPAEVKSWLALFEIFRVERLAGEFAELARRFKEQHGKSDYWRKVQYFGREIDPGNKLFQDERIASFETIGPAEARRMAAEASFDPITENWLNAPMDFQNEVLANELRRGLMAKAGLNENDLVPNPMPALRNIEMFTVA